MPPSDGFDPEDGSTVAEDDVVEGNIPADEDGEDGSEYYVRSYEPLSATMSLEQIEAIDGMMSVGSRSLPGPAA